MLRIDTIGLDNILENEDTEYTKSNIVLGMDDDEYEVDKNVSTFRRDETGTLKNKATGCAKSDLSPGINEYSSDDGEKNEGSDEDENESEDDENEDDENESEDEIGKDNENGQDAHVDFDFASIWKAKEILEQKRAAKKSKEEDLDMDNTYLDIGGSKIINSDVRQLTDMDEIMSKSVLKPGFEQLHSIPPYVESQRKLKMERKKERDRTKGSQWFNLPATELTEEVKRDLEVLQMRSVLNPKHFYKKNDLKVLPKYFQVGRVIEAPADFYNSRVPKKDRKRTMVEELMADAEFKKYNKKRYTEIIEQRRKTHFKSHRQAKKLKRKKK